MTVNTTFDRNGHLDRFEDFRAIRLTTKEIVEQMTLRKRGIPETRTDEIVKNLSTADLVRYRLGSGTMYSDNSAMGLEKLDVFDDHNTWNLVARFGVLDRATGLPLLHIYASRKAKDKPFKIMHVAKTANGEVPSELVLEVLTELDLPASRSWAAGGGIADSWDIFHEDGEWTMKEPMHLVCFTFKRTCYDTIPETEERIDVPVIEEADRPLDGGGDAEAAYDTKYYYSAKSWQALPEEYRGMSRPGYSSWGNYEEPKRVKVVSLEMRARFSTEATHRTDAAPAPAPETPSP